MKKNFIVIVIVVLVFVSVLAIFMSKSNKGSSKLDGFAQALSNSGAKFYGAFWCPHCQAEKKEFGASAKYLPYIECSTPDGQAQTQICKDNNVEAYPTWTFKDGIKVTSLGEPLICPKVKDGEKPSDNCKNISSSIFSVWVFPGDNFSIRSTAEPVKSGDTWKFEVGSQATGEIPLQFLADQIQFTLPN